MKYRSVLTFALALGAATGAHAQTVTKTAQVPFTNHIAIDLIEVDVYVDGKGGVRRVGPKEADAYLKAPIFTTAHPVEHEPKDESKKGPYPKGKPMGMTFGEWLAAKGDSMITCRDGKGQVEAEFEKLVPNGIYTIWYWTMATTKTVNRQSIEMPLGAPDGSEATFTADAKGQARYSASFEPCLQGGGGRFMTELAIAYHSDGKTYGYWPGEFGNRSHIHLFNVLPADAEL